MNMRYRIALVGVLTLFLILAGCGESEDDDRSDIETVEDLASAMEQAGEPQDDADTPYPREDPVPLGEAVMLGEWEVHISDVNWDVADNIKEYEEEFFVSPSDEWVPEPDHQYMAVTFTGTYHGDGSGGLRPWPHLLSDRNVADFDRYAGHTLFEQGDTTFTGGTTSVQEAWIVPDGDLESLILFTEEMPGRPQMFWALR